MLSQCCEFSALVDCCITDTPKCFGYSLTCISLDIAFALGTQQDQKRDKHHEIYMPNENPALAYPTRIIFHWPTSGVSIGGNANFRVQVSGNVNFRVGVGSARLFRYQHVGIPNAKFSRSGYWPTRTLNARSLALQWNIGLSVMIVKTDREF